MRHLKLFSLILMTAIFACLKNTQSKNPFDPENEKKTLRHIKEALWPMAYSTSDTALLNQILHNDFQLIDGAGIITDKKFELNWVKENRINHDSFRYEIKRLDVYHNNTAIISGTGHIVNKGKESIYQSSNVLIKQDSLWKAILSHVSGYRTL